MSEHPGHRVLERFSVDDLPPTLRAEIAAHVRDCPRCREAVAGIDGDRVAQLEALPAERFALRVAARHARQARRRRLLLGTGGTALALAAALVFLVRPAGDLRIKGGALQVHVRRDGVVRPLGADEPIAAGDALQLTLGGSATSLVSAWFVDADGRVDALAAEGPVRLAAGAQPFPVSATVEAPCRDLWLVVARDASRSWSDEALRALVADLRAGAALPSGMLARGFKCR